MFSALMSTVVKVTSLRGNHVDMIYCILASCLIYAKPFRHPLR